MTISDEMVEAGARGIFEARHKGLKNCHSWDDSSLDDEHPAARERYIQDARAALTAALQGSVVVPAEAVPVDKWRIVVDELVLIYVVHTNAEYESDPKIRQEKWEGWTVGRWIKHHAGGWMYYGMMGRVTHVAPLPAPPVPRHDGKTATGGAA